MIKNTLDLDSTCGWKILHFLLVIGFLLIPAAGVFASSPSNDDVVSGKWEITIHDPGGWLAEGMTNGKYWQTAETWETKNGEPIMKPQDFEYSLDLIAVENEISGTYQWKLAGESGFTPAEDDSSSLFKNDSLSGELSGTIQGNQITLKMKTFADLSGTITGTSMQGSGTMWHYRIGIDENDYTDIPDRPVTFSGTLAEVAGSDCQAKISTPENLTPGDDLWVSAIFTDPAGKEIVPKSHAYYINGKETTSVKWSGEAAQIELQYVCPNGKMRSEKLTIPAYVEPKPEEKPEKPVDKPENKEKAQDEESEPDSIQKPKEATKTNPQEENPGGIDLEQVANIAVIGGGMLTAVSGAVGAGLVIKTLAESAKAANVAKNVAAAVQMPQATSQASKPSVQKPPQKTEPPRSKPGKERITQAEANRLRQRLQQLQNERAGFAQRQDLLRQAQQNIYHARERMILSYQRNAARVILRMGLDIHRYIEPLYNPGTGIVRAVNEIVQDAMGGALQAHPEGATDAQILENQRQNIRRLNEGFQNIKQERHNVMIETERNLREIQEIENRLDGAVELLHE